MKDQQGQSLLLVTSMIFIFIIYSLLLTSSVLTTNKVSRFRETKQIDLWIAEAGIEKALYCFNNKDKANCGGTSGDSYAGESSVPFNIGVFSTAVSSVTADERAIVSTASYRGIKRTIRKMLYKNYQTDDVNVDFALYVGLGGLLVQGTGTINGDIYSNGDVSCTSGVIGDDVTIAGTGRLFNCAVDGSATVNTIEDSTIQVNAHYQTIINSTVAGTSYPDSPDPPTVNSGITDELIDKWKLDAAGGTLIAGDLTVDSSISLGPVEITGDLIFSGNATLTITGVIYVHGNIEFNDNAKLALHGSFLQNSGVLLADGIITADNSGKFHGTGQGGIISIISTSISNPAITIATLISGSGNDVSLCAPNGGVLIASGAKVKHACGKSIIIGSGGEIKYTEGAGYVINYLSDINLETLWEIREGTRNE